MSTIPMYHVNRYDENKSLVQQSSMLDKANLNLEVLIEPVIWICLQN